MNITQNEETINEEYRSYLAEEIWRAINFARKGKMELSLEDMANILKTCFAEEEIEQIKKYL